MDDGNRTILVLLAVRSVSEEARGHAWRCDVLERDSDTNKTFDKRPLRVRRRCVRARQRWRRDVDGIGRQRRVTQRCERDEW